MNSNINPTLRFTNRIYVTALLGFLCTAFGAMWLFSANAQTYFMDKDYGQWSAKMDMMRRCDTGDVAIIGDSRMSAGIVPDLLRPLVVRNLALTGATPIEGYFEVQRILACPKPPRAIILSFASRQYQDAFWFWRHAGRYGFLSFAELQEVSHMEQALGRSFIYKSSFGAEPPAPMKNWLYAHDFRPFNFGSMIAAHGFLRKRENDTVRSETLATGGHHIEGSYPCATEPGWEAQQARFTAEPIITSYFERMIALAQSHSRVAILLPRSAT